MQKADNTDNLIIHPFEPVFGPDSRILILGTLPSVQSRGQGFYYGHPRNRFWRVLAQVLDKSLPVSLEQKRIFLLNNQIALWDVLRQCRIVGSQDSSIREPVANDLAALLAQAPIRQIFTNGQSATRLYRQFCEIETGRPCIPLPSTSPANGRWPLDKLCQAWQPVREALIDETLQGR